MVSRQTNRMVIHPFTEALQKAQRWAGQRGQSTAKTGEQNPKIVKATADVQRLNERAESMVARHGEAWRQDLNRVKAKDGNFVPNHFRGTQRTIQLEQQARQALGNLDYAQRKHDALVDATTSESVAKLYEQRFRDNWERDLAVEKQRNPKVREFGYQGRPVTQRLGKERDDAGVKWQAAEAALKAVLAERPTPYGGSFQSSEERAAAAVKPVPPSNVSQMQGVRDLGNLASSLESARAAADNDTQVAIADAVARLRMAQGAASGQGNFGSGGGLDREQGRRDTLTHLKKAEDRLAEAAGKASDGKIRELLTATQGRLQSMTANIQKNKPTTVVRGPTTVIPRKRMGKSSQGSGGGGKIAPITVRAAAKVGP